MPPGPSLVEIAHFHPKHGFSFFSDEPDWPLGKPEPHDFSWVEIVNPFRKEENNA